MLLPLLLLMGVGARILTPRAVAVSGLSLAVSLFVGGHLLGRLAARHEQESLCECFALIAGIISLCLMAAGL